MAPILFFYDITIRNLTNDDPTVRARIETSIKDMEFTRSKPGQTWYRSWVDEAISQAVGEETHELDLRDDRDARTRLHANVGDGALCLILTSTSREPARTTPTRCRRCCRSDRRGRAARTAC